MTESIVLDIGTWTLISSLFLPLLVGLVTKKVASASIKSTLLALFAAVNGAVSSAIQDQGILTHATLSAAFVSFVVAVSSYYGYLKPAGVSVAVQDKTENFGLG